MADIEETGQTSNEEATKPAQAVQSAREVQPAQAVTRAEIAAAPAATQPVETQPAVEEPAVDHDTNRFPRDEEAEAVREGSVLVYARENAGVNLQNEGELRPGREYVAGPRGDEADPRDYVPLDLARELVRDRVCDVIA